MTLVGDVAQSTAPAGQERWADVFAHLSTAVDAVGRVAELTIGYRVPEPILTVANRLLPRTGVDASASRSVRVDGHDPAWVHTTPDELPAQVARAVPRRSSTATASPVSSPTSSCSTRSTPRSTLSGCTPSTTSTSCTPARSRCSAPSR